MIEVFYTGKISKTILCRNKKYLADYSHSGFLTPNIDSIMIYHINPYFCIGRYLKVNFITVSEIRENKLNEIGI